MDTRTTCAEELLAAAGRLRDDALLAAVRSLLGRERCVTAELIAHLAEIDLRGLHKREGYASLFVYCRDALGLSEHEAYGRIEAARAARKFPLALELLRSGAITLTSVGLLARHLTAGNHRAILESACGKKKAEVEEIVAALQPAADVPAALRKLPPPSQRTEPSSDAPAAPNGVASNPTATAIPSPAVTASSPTAPLLSAMKPSVIAPLSPNRYRYQLTIGTETRDLLALAKDLLRHVDPSGDDDVILKRALQLLVSDLTRKKFGTPEMRDRERGTDRPTASGSRHVPAGVKRAVFLRDGGRCAFFGRHGHRCEERGFLEFHHVKPYAVGGEATLRNIELRCRNHNQYEARLYFERQLVSPLLSSPGSAATTT